MILKRLETHNIIERGKRTFDLAPVFANNKTEITLVSGKPASGKTMLGILLNEIRKFILGRDSQLQSLIADPRESSMFSLIANNHEASQTVRLDVTFKREFLREERLYSVPTYVAQNLFNDPDELPVYEWHGYHRAFVSHATMFGTLNNKLANWHIAAGNMPVRGPIYNAELLEILLKLVDPQVKSVKASNDSNRFIVIEHARRGPIVLVDGELREADKQTMSRSVTDMLDIARIIERMEEPGLFYIDERLSNLSHHAKSEVLSICQQNLQRGSHLFITAKSMVEIPPSILNRYETCKLEVNNDM